MLVADDLWSLPTYQELLYPLCRNDRSPSASSEPGTGSSIAGTAAPRCGSLPPL